MTPEDRTRFIDLMTQYDNADCRLEELKEEKANVEATHRHLRDLLRDEVMNMGLGKGVKLPVEGTGSFSFTTQEHASLPAQFREDFVHARIEAGEEALLTIGKNDLKAWVKERREAGEDVPEYIKMRQDKFVPVIQLDSRSARRAEKAAVKAQRGE